MVVAKGNQMGATHFGRLSHLDEPFISIAVKGSSLLEPGSGPPPNPGLAFWPMAVTDSHGCFSQNTQHTT